ncbi:hypothetical protein [Paraglaciecola hydrolytica]|uniref:Uncharacterized protein n=1 Tax=Paraglaciecola hydrolytica TaxID=1799789 RepID=A0A148KLD5_9ALTE|nr:hypothetical protein [Paraglaciecola hydrolytica]KXI27142.1 hypothetical protein AX660_01785 [Paraglaciecola hydrolytica]
MIDRTEINYCLFGVFSLAIVNIIDLLLDKPFWIITKMMNLGSDTNFPAWFSSMLLALAGLLAYQCFHVAKKYKTQGHYSLLLFSLLLFALSADEIARIHETLGEFLSKQSGLASQDQPSNAGWVFVGGPIAVIVFTLVTFRLRQFLLLVPQSLTYLVLGFASIILGGIVLESTTNYLNHDNLQWLWDIEIIVEETLEMIGSIFIMLALVIWRNTITERNNGSSN